MNLDSYTTRKTSDLQMEPKQVYTLWESKQLPVNQAEFLQKLLLGIFFCINVHSCNSYDFYHCVNFTPVSFILPI